MDIPRLVIKYCDRCKWDTDDIDETTCQKCGQELDEANGRGDIP